MAAIEAVELTQALVRLDSVNPPGHEEPCAALVEPLLRSAGFEVERHAFAPGRTSLVARLEGRDRARAPLLLTGHLDTVPLGQADWSVDPFGAEIVDGVLYGRGACDMKSGVAALVAAALEVVAEERPGIGLLLVLTAGEEIGCEGARCLAALPGALGPASGILVGEPTGNRPALGHKGALFLDARTRGLTAHSSMPELGVNAIYRAARAIGRLEGYRFDVPADPLLGLPTLNVGMMSGGLNANSVPDRARFTIDVRSTPALPHERAIEHLRALLGDEVELEPFVDAPAVSTAPEDPFARVTLAAVAARLGEPAAVRALPFATDAAILGPHCAAPTVVLGPGETALAHQVDERCSVEAIELAVRLYADVIRAWDLAGEARLGVG